MREVAVELCKMLEVAVAVFSAAAGTLLGITAVVYSIILALKLYSWLTK